MMYPRPIATGTSLASCLTLANWAAVSGDISLEAPPDDRYGVAPCLKITSGAGANAIADLNLNSQLTGRFGVLIYMKPYESAAGDINNTQNCLLYLSNDAGFANFFTRTIQVRPGWNYIVVGRAPYVTTSVKEATWQSSGSPSWASPFAKIRVRVNSQASSSTEIWVRAIRDGDYHQPVVMFDFDDALGSVYTDAFPVLEGLGFKGVLNVISSKVGVAGYMTQEQIEEVYQAGWDIGNHSKDHETNVQSNSYAYWVDQIQGCQAYLESNGWTRRDCHRHYVAPYGYNSWRTADNYRQAIRDLCITGRVVVERPMGAWLDDPYAVSCMQQYGGSETIANTFDRLAATIGIGGVHRFLCHELVSPANTDTKMTPADFQALAKRVYRLARGGAVAVSTWTEWYGAMKDQMIPVATG